MAPKLLSFAKNKAITLQTAAAAQEGFSQIFHLPLSEEAFIQMQNLLQLLTDIQLTENNDSWRYSWGDKFSSSNAYRALVGHHQAHNVYKVLWKCICQPKHKVFFWLLLKDRLNTRNILKRKNTHLDSFNCVLCLQNTKETCQHLFLQCPFAKQCWEMIYVDIPLNETFPELSDYLKDRLHSQFFLTAVVLICWTIWTARNDLIFKGIQPSLPCARRLFSSEMLLLMHRVKPSLANQFDQWIQTMV